MKCIGRTKQELPETVTISMIRKGWQGALNVLTYLSSHAPGNRFEVVHHGDSVYVLPMDRKTGNIYLVRQLRHKMIFAGRAGRLALDTVAGRSGCKVDPVDVPSQQMFPYDIPSGKIEEQEGPHEAAVRALLKQAGITCTQSDLIPLDTVFASIGSTTERLHLFIASVDDQERVEPTGDEREPIEVWKMHYTRMVQLLDEDAVRNAGGRLALEMSLRLIRARTIRLEETAY